MNGMYETGNAISAVDLNKRYRGGFELKIPELRIPNGFATALIGENGSGKTTLLQILAGIRLDFQGKAAYFDSQGEISDPGVKEKIGYGGLKGYFRARWTLGQVAEMGELLFEGFHEDRFWDMCGELGLGKDRSWEISHFSDGGLMKLLLALLLARDTELLILDEPDAPLDPLMRERFCDMMREYLVAGDGARSVLFSTHNIADMENITDYVIILDRGRIVEQGFAEELKEKYVLVKGERGDAERAGRILLSMTVGNYGFEGICMAGKRDQLAGMDVALERPGLHQISVAVIRANKALRAFREEGRCPAR